MIGPERLVAAACCLLLALGVVLLSLSLLRHPSVQAWLQLSGPICIAWMLIGGILFLMEGRR